MNNEQRLFLSAPAGCFPKSVWKIFDNECNYFSKKTASAIWKGKFTFYKKGICCIWLGRIFIVQVIVEQAKYYENILLNIFIKYL